MEIGPAAWTFRTFTSELLAYLHCLLDPQPLSVRGKKKVSDTAHGSGPGRRRRFWSQGGSDPPPQVG